MFGKYNIKTITKHETPKVIKISWILVLCASFFVLCFYVQGCYEKLAIKPEILVNEKHIPSFDIPFPAITICSPLKIKMEYSNLSAIREDVMQNKSLSPEDETILARAAHFCHSDFNHLQEIHKNKSYNEDILNTLSAHSPDINEAFAECSLYEHKFKCENLFIRSMTEYGYCYTFNMIGYNSMFDGSLASEFDIYKRKKITKSWTKSTEQEFHDDDEDPEDLTFSIDNGYLEEIYDVQPLRAAKLQSLGFKLKLNETDRPNNCEYHSFSYLLFVHLPVDLPSHLNQFTIAELNSYKFIQVSATLKNNDQSLKDFSPEKRGCYFEDERKLKFFKSYSKTKCDFECMRNFTLIKCGCVKLSLLRTKDDKLCDVNSLKCYKEISKSWPNSYYKDRKIKKGVIDFPCYCLPSCTQIKYDIVNEHSRELKYSDHTEDGYIHSMVSIIFIDSEIIETTNYITYRLQNFISDIGGLAGLFLGFSLLTLFELILGITSYCRKLIKRLKNDKGKRVQNSVKVKHNVKNKPQIRIVNEKPYRPEVILYETERERGNYDKYVHNRW
ncbi:sodium channel protein Nach-like [Chironomus tepperi]|uniref:sodium channel protein Nach-like n=1 Tax=Chironomus tepperi TaxID=113505 RepID=UPI00391F36AD